MNYSELLHDFVENSLSTSNEETLFQALAADEELRFELKYLLTLRDTIREDDEAGVVPITTTQAIFTKLGYTAPAAVGAGGAIAGSQAGIFTAIKSWGGYVVAMLIGAFLTGGIFIMTDAEKGSPVFTEAIQQTHNNVVDQAVENQTSELVGAQTETGQLVVVPDNNRNVTRSLVESTRNRQETKRLSDATIPRPLTQAAPDNISPVAPDIQTKSVVNNDDSEDANNQSKDSFTETSEFSLRPEDFAIISEEIVPVVATLPEQIANASPSPEIISRSPEEIALDHYERPALFGAYIKGTALPINLQESELQTPASDAGLENVAVGVTYNANSNFSVVLEGGKESYLLSFKTPKSDDRVFIHEARPSILWGGIGGRYSFTNSSRFTPFSQLVIGGSEAGMMGRGMIGLNWDATDRIGFNVGAEYSVVGYRYLGDLNLSDRLGLTYGLTFDIAK